MPTGKISPTSSSKISWWTKSSEWSAKSWWREFQSSRTNWLFYRMKDCLSIWLQKKDWNILPTEKLPGNLTVIQWKFSTLMLCSPKTTKFRFTTSWANWRDSGFWTAKLLIWRLLEALLKDSMQSLAFQMGRFWKSSWTTVSQSNYIELLLESWSVTWMLRRRNLQS